MPLNFVAASSVAAGVFNIHVFQRSFLRRMEIIDDIEQAIMAELSKPGFHFLGSRNLVHWQVRPDRLIASTRSRDHDCGLQMAEVLRALKWTPLIGVNTSLEFEGDASNIEMMQRHNRFSTGNAIDGVVAGTASWAYELARPPQKFVFQATLLPAPDGSQAVKLHINAHTDVGEEVAQEQEDANERAVAACRNYRTYFNEAIDFARRALDIEIAI